MADEILTSLIFSLLVVFPVNIWSKLVAELLADKVELTLEDDGIINVAVYGNEDLTIDCTVEHPVKSTEMATNAVITCFIRLVFM